MLSIILEKHLHLLLKNAIFAFEINLITDRCQETLILICFAEKTYYPAWPSLALPM